MIVIKGLGCGLLITRGLGAGAAYRHDVIPVIVKDAFCPKVVKRDTALAAVKDSFRSGIGKDARVGCFVSSRPLPKTVFDQMAIREVKESPASNISRVVSGKSSHVCTSEGRKPKFAGKLPESKFVK